MAEASTDSQAATPSFEEYVAEKNLRNARLAALLVATLAPSGVALDWIVHQDQVTHLFTLRIASALVALVVYYLTYRPFAIRHTFALGAMPVLVMAVAIELMIEHLEGYSSPYYAGLTHCLLGLGVIFYWRVREILLACAIVVGVWLVPTLLQYQHLEVGPFTNNFYALVVAAAIAIASNARRYAAAQREHDARTRLEDAYSQLQELDHAKNRFFANVSHELRTPLTLILAPLARMLERSELNRDDRNSLETVQRNAARLLRHIDELLELSRLDAGRRRLNLGTVNLRALVTTQWEATHDAAHSRGIEMTLDAPDDVPNVYGDVYAIDTVLSNLVGNAIKYTPDGASITLRVINEEEHGVVQVIDSGAGIPEEDLPHVFERFYQVNATDRRRQGAGIGLAVAKELTELHGGTLSVESCLGAGSTFQLKLKKGRRHFRPEAVERRKTPQSDHPRRRYEDSGQRLGPLDDTPLRPPSDRAKAKEGTVDARAVKIAGQRAPRVLVVEDQTDLRAMLQELLETEYDVSTAPDGRAALEQILEDPPDLVVSDIMMPRLSGTELCQHIKSNPALQTIPIILLTARVGSEATMDAYAHGADDFVAKPFSPEVLRARVRAQLRLRMLALQLVAREKAAVVGTLAAGVAHEVKNPLNAIINAGRVLQKGNRTPELESKLTGVIVDASARIDRIVDALDTHSRPADPQSRAPFDPCRGLDSSLLLLEHRMDGISVNRDYAQAAEVEADVRAINQVILNLLDNAVRSGATELWLSVRRDDKHVAVSVADNGSGVDPANEKKVFDPFFTTRDPGIGTGLGLHLSMQIITAHGGKLWHDRRPGGGAVFQFTLPRPAASAP